MIYKRHSIRLKEFDYTSNGYYFVTICSQDRVNFFRNVGVDRCVDPKLNEIGKSIECWWKEIPKRFNNILLDEFIIMPNHVHGILIINKKSEIHFVLGQTHRSDALGQTHRSAPTLITVGNVIRWFKTMTTNEYIKNVKINNWPKFNKRLWQRNYYERIIRNESEYLKIKQYIKLNPEMWSRDRNNQT